MLYLRKTNSYTLSCNRLDSETEGIHIGVYKQESIASLIEENGKLILQINKPQCEAQNIEISFVDNDWNKLK